MGASGEAQHGHSQRGPLRRVTRLPGARRVASCESAAYREWLKEAKKGRPSAYPAAGRPHSVKHPAEPQSPHQHAVTRASPVQFGSVEPKEEVQWRSRPASLLAGDCTIWPHRGTAAALCTGATALRGGRLQERFPATFSAGSPATPSALRPTLTRPTPFFPTPSTPRPGTPPGPTLSTRAPVILDRAFPARDLPTLGPESYLKPRAARRPAPGRARRSQAVAADPPRRVASPAACGGAAGGRVSGACRTSAGWPW